MRGSPGEWGCSDRTGREVLHSFRYEFFFTRHRSFDFPPQPPHGQDRQRRHLSPALSLDVSGSYTSGQVLTHVGRLLPSLVVPASLELDAFRTRCGLVGLELPLYDSQPGSFVRRCFPPSSSPPLSAGPSVPSFVRQSSQHDDARWSRGLLYPSQAMTQTKFRQVRGLTQLVQLLVTGGPSLPRSPSSPAVQTLAIAF